ncbi:MAG: hypothetical protein K0U84_13380 [Actinomycetia bacterium]|nr:hypothetical protein [Actinomycetes bacterium]
MTTCVDVINKALALLASDPITATVISSGITTADPDTRGIPDTDDVNDGDLEVGVSTTTEIQALNPYTVVRFDLGSEKHIAYVNIFGLKISAGSSNEFFLQHSLDAIHWETLGRHLDVDTTATFFRRNGPVSTRYLRLARVGATDLDTAVATVAEIDVYEFGSNDKDSTCRTLYDVCRDSVLAHHAWRAGVFKRRLTKLSTEPISEWDYEYSLPADLETSGPRAVFTTPTQRIPYKEWELTGGKLLCNINEATDSDGDYTQGIWVDYQARMDEEDMPAHVLQLLVYALAADLAEPITDQTTKADFWGMKAWGTASDEGAGGYSRQARRIESQNKPSEAIQDHSLVDVRYGP